MRLVGSTRANPCASAAVARTVGWVAYWNEMMANSEKRIFRPRQLYTGPAEREVVLITERATHEPLVG